mmetsp:Transcript_6288/g.18061  ORF Transcript_6288/g.18061 Transcript_6288/m.18061 type:complete len:365 (-) Transcript_6288:138-1232(-)
MDKDSRRLRGHRHPLLAVLVARHRPGQARARHRLGQVRPRRHHRHLEGRERAAHDPLPRRALVHPAPHPGLHPLPVRLPEPLRAGAGLVVQGPVAGGRPLHPHLPVVPPLPRHVGGVPPRGAHLQDPARPLGHLRSELGRGGGLLWIRPPPRHFVHQQVAQGGAEGPARRGEKAGEERGGDGLGRGHLRRCHHLRDGLPEDLRLPLGEDQRRLGHRQRRPLPLPPDAPCERPRLGPRVLRRRVRHSVQHHHLRPPRGVHLQRARRDRGAAQRGGDAGGDREGEGLEAELDARHVEPGGPRAAPPDPLPRPAPARHGRRSGAEVLPQRAVLPLRPRGLQRHHQERVGQRCPIAAQWSAQREMRRS